MSDTDKTLALMLICIILLSLFPMAGYLVIILLLSHLIRRNKLGEVFKTLKKDPGLIFLLSALGLSTLLSKYHMAGLVGFAAFSIQLLLFVIIRSFITDRSQNHSMIRYILLTSLIVSVVGIIQYYFASHMSPDWVDKHLYNNIPNRAFSTLYNPNVLGSYLILVISIAVAGFHCSEKSQNKIVTSIVLIAAYLCMVLTFSRGAWLGLAISILIVFLFSKEKPYILAVIFITLLLVIPELDAVLTRINPGLLSDDSSNIYRHYLWTTAFDTFKQNPIFGSGLGSFGFSLPSHSKVGGYLVSHAHNIYLQLLAELGLLGFIAFFGYLISIVYTAFKVFRYSLCPQTRSFALGAMAGLIGLLVHGTVDATIYLPQLSVFVWIIAAVVKNMGNLDLPVNSGFKRLSMFVKPLLNRMFLNIK